MSLLSSSCVQICYLVVCSHSELEKNFYFDYPKVNFWKVLIINYMLKSMHAKTNLSKLNYYLRGYKLMLSDFCYDHTYLGLFLSNHICWG